MSDEKKINIEETMAYIEKEATRESKRKEVQEKELIVRERRAINEIEKIKESDKATEIAKNTNYGSMSEATIQTIQQDNKEYILAARNRTRFVSEDFDNIVPCFRKNLILVGGKTGEGKSTTVANLVLEMLREKNSVTKQNRKILVITNEEAPSDVFNRVACLMSGWDYVSHDKFTDKQLEIFNRCIQLLSKDGRLTVIDQNYEGSIGTTTTLEGICQIFDNLIENKTYYDAVILDYYQRVTESRKNPSMNVYDVQAALVHKLDSYKNIYPAPIIVLAQVKPPDSQNTPFEMRIKGRKTILDSSTCALEMIPNREDLTTEWIVHKNRFNGRSVGKKITTGYDKGRYVKWDDAFRDAVSKMKAARERDDFDKMAKMPTVSEEESDDQ